MRSLLSQMSSRSLDPQQLKSLECSFHNVVYVFALSHVKYPSHDIIHYLVGHYQHQYLNNTFLTCDKRRPD